MVEKWKKENFRSKWRGYKDIHCALRNMKNVYIECCTLVNHMCVWEYICTITKTEWCAMHVRNLCLFGGQTSVFYSCLSVINGHNVRYAGGMHDKTKLETKVWVVCKQNESLFLAASLFCICILVSCVLARMLQPSVYQTEEGEKTLVIDII